MGKPLRVLVIEDSEDDVLLVIRALQKGGYDPIYERVETRDAMHQALERETWDIIISDYKMPHFGGLAALKLYKEKGLNIPFIIVSGTIGEEAAAAAMVSGAHDYVMKNNLPRLVPAIQRELKEAESRRERKRAEEDLKKSKILLDSVFSAIQDLILIVDKDLKVLISNWKSPAYTGDTKSPGTPHCYEAFIHRDVPCESCHALEVFATGKTVLTEHFNPSTKRFSDIRAYPIFDDNNQVIMVAEHVRDITERKRAEDAFQKTQNLMNEVGKIARIGGWKMDLINQKATWTQGTYDIVEIAPGAPIPGPDEHVDYYLPECRPLVVEAMRALIEDDKPLDFEAQLRTAKGNVKWCRAMGRVVREGGKAVEVYGTFQDITERKRSEEEARKHSEQLIAKNEELRAMTQQLWQAAKLATMGELSASVAHELNNPLATVSMRAESLLTKTQQDSPMWRELKIIEQEVERMATLIANLLQFSRRSQPQISTVDICEEIEKALELIYYHLRKRDIVIWREFAKEAPHIHADRQQLRQLFLNLFTNASDAMPKGGTLTIRVTVPLESKQVIMEVADTGTGIPPEILMKVAEPFYSTKPEGEGTGLGLAICRRIVQEHNGTFDLTSEGIPGKGTTARISLPVTSGTNSASLKNQ